MIIQMRGFINNRFINSEIYQTTSHRHRESKIIQTGKDLRRQWVETTIERCVQQRAGLAVLDLDAFTCPVTHKLSDSTRGHTGTLFISRGGQHLNRGLADDGGEFLEQSCDFRRIWSRWIALSLVLNTNFVVQTSSMNCFLSKKKTYFQHKSWGDLVMCLPFVTAEIL